MTTGGRARPDFSNWIRTERGGGGFRGTRSQGMRWEDTRKKTVLTLGGGLTFNVQGRVIDERTGLRRG